MVDVFPSRNALPGASANWGRAVEDRVTDNERSLTILDQSVQGLNRSTAASLSDLAGQLTALGVAQSELNAQQAQLAAQQTQITNQLVRSAANTDAIGVTFAANTSASAWSTVPGDTLSLTFTATAVRTVITFGQFWSIPVATGIAAAVETRIVVNGTAQVVGGYPLKASGLMNPGGGLFGDVGDASANVGTSYTIATSPGTSYTITLQYRYSTRYVTSAVAATLRNRFISMTPSS